MQLTEFLTELLGSLRDSGADFCVLRNYQNLPEANLGNDIDLLISENRVKDAIRIVQKMPDVRVTGFNERAYVTTLYMENIHDGEKDSLQLDLVTRLAWKGLTYLDNTAVFSESTMYKNRPLIRVPAKHHEAIISFFSSYLLGGWIKDRYQDSIRSVFKANPQLVCTSLGWIGNPLVDQLVEGVRQDDRRRLMELLPDIKKKLIRSEICNRPLKMVGQVLKHYAHEIRIRYTDYPIVQVCVLGVDGAGKSTIIRAISERLGSRVKDCEIIHLKHRRKQSVAESHTVCSDPHALPPRSGITSILKLLSWVIVYHWKKIIHGHANSTLIIWDRYIYDAIADSRRYRVKIQRNILKAISNLAPRMDGVIILDVRPEIAFDRKPEVALPELYQIRERYLRLACEIKPSIIVDTSISVNKSVASAFEFVSGILAVNAARKIRKKLRGKTPI